MLLDHYVKTRQHSVSICESLETEDYVVQPVADVSPPKWHLGHTTWFFETFILKPFQPLYQEYNPDYNFVFNSYYETLGSRVIRTNRGNLSRPTVAEVYNYRQYVDEAMQSLLQQAVSDEVKNLIWLGLNHEEQHQELLATDIKYILGHNPLFPAYAVEISEEEAVDSSAFINIPEGIYEIGYQGENFCFDNELAKHQVFLHPFAISDKLVTNAEFLDFITDDGYKKFQYWHAEGWDWVKTDLIEAPLYWHKINGVWFNYTPFGLKPIELNQPVCHISYFEASAFAGWKSMRLPTEFEWEVAQSHLNWGRRWEWTESAYLPYPGFKKAAGAIGEYNGKFMINQMVLRGASDVTPKGHSRPTYRNFFHPHLRWQYTGIRLAKTQIL